MTAESYQQKQFSIQSFQIKRHSNISNNNHSCKLCICNTYISGSITSCCLKKPLLATFFSPSNMSQSKPSSMSQSNPGKNSRKREEMGDTEIPRLLKKRTLILGEEVWNHHLRRKRKQMKIRSPRSTDSFQGGGRKTSI